MCSSSPSFLLRMFVPVLDPPVYRLWILSSTFDLLLSLNPVSDLEFLLQVVLFLTLRRAIPDEGLHSLVRTLQENKGIILKTNDMINQTTGLIKKVLLFRDSWGCEGSLLHWHLKCFNVVLYFANITELRMNPFWVCTTYSGVRTTSMVCVLVCKRSVFLYLFKI